MFKKLDDSPIMGINGVSVGETFLEELDGASFGLAKMCFPPIS